MKKLRDLIPNPFAAKAPPTSGAIAAQLDAARQELAAKQEAFGAAALAAVEEPTINVDQAEQAVTEIKRKVTRLEAAFVAAQAREEADHRTAIRKAEDASDAEVREACDEGIKAAKGIEATVAAYVSAITPFAVAYAKAQSVAMGNPRSRRDIASYMVSPASLLADELARLAPAGVKVPGMNLALLQTTTADRITPLASRIEQTLNDMKPPVRHG